MKRLSNFWLKLDTEAYKLRRPYKKINLLIVDHIHYVYKQSNQKLKLT